MMLKTNSFLCIRKDGLLTRLVKNNYQCEAEFLTKIVRTVRFRYIAISCREAGFLKRKGFVCYVIETR